jgi:hypothetical protein
MSQLVLTLNDAMKLQSKAQEVTNQNASLVSENDSAHHSVPSPYPGFQMVGSLS